MKPRQPSLARSSAALQVTEIRPRSGWFDLDLAGVWRYRELLHFLVLRDLKVRYKQATLGVLWVLVQPIFTVFIFTVVFGLFARLPSDGVPYPLFAFSAVMPWMLFSEAMRRSTLGLIGDGVLISKVYFPRLIIPLANVLTPAIDFVVTLIVFLVFMQFYDVTLTVNLLVLPLLFVITILMGLSIGLWLGPINVKFRDVTHTLPLLLQLWMYATPIVYPISIVPEKYHNIYSLNPMVGLIEAYRWALLDKGNLDVKAIVIGFTVMVILLVAGLVFFRRSERMFADTL